MSMESLIPFGLHKESKQLVDVASVQRGQNCGCICPSCEIPLIARHGNRKEWHFAHQSRSSHAKVKKECEYSFGVSVRLMIRQLAMQGLRLQVPRFVHSMQATSEKARTSHTVEVEVTGKSTIQLESPGVGIQFSGVEVDVIGHVEEIPFILYVTYAGRDVPAALENPVIERSGVIKLRVDGLYQIFRDQRDGGYLRALGSYIEETTSGISWVHHPRLPGAKLEAEKMLADWILDQDKKEAALELDNTGSVTDSTISALMTEGATTPSHKKVIRNYECIICKNRWSDSSPICVTCNTHLYTREV